MPQNKLTARSVEEKKQRGRYSDGGGLVLQVSKWGTRAWIFRYQRAGRERHMGLGAAETVSLADAREHARQCRLLLRDDRDPIEERQAKRQQDQLERARLVTFKDCAENYMASHRPGWRNAN